LVAPLAGEVVFAWTEVHAAAVVGVETLADGAETLADAAGALISATLAVAVASTAARIFGAVVGIELAPFQGAICMTRPTVPGVPGFVPGAPS